jgi:hypothetical protein
MGDLPRFSRGEIGRLKFSDLNEAFTLLDALRPLLTVAQSAAAQTDEVLILARIISSGTYGDHDWEEVVVLPTNLQRWPLEFELRDGGRNSGSRFSPDYEPAFPAAPFGSGFGGQVALRIVPDTVCVLRKMKRKDGRIFWLALTQPTVSWPALIEGAVAMPAVGSPPKVYRWRYIWREVEADPQSGSWVIKPNGLFGNYDPQSSGLGPAWNGAEADNIIGAGGSGAGGIESNARIANGIVVPMTMNKSVPWFCLGNTLSVSCGATP